MFNRSVKPFYIIVLGVVAAMLIFLNEKSHKHSSHKFLILFLGLLCVISSELNSEFLSISFINNIFLVFLPILIFILTYIGIFNLSKKNI